MIAGATRNRVGAALVVLAVVLFVVPALFPVQPMLTHDTNSRTSDSPAELREQGIRIIAYENLSERGQELYVRALENDGDLHVSQGDGAPEFLYPTSAERREAFETDNMTAAGSVVIERPDGGGGLPAADERFFGPPPEETENEEEIRRQREQAERYDLMRTATEQPPLGSPPQLLRLGAVVFAVISLGTGGYFLSSKG